MSDLSLFNTLAPFQMGSSLDLLLNPGAPEKIDRTLYISPVPQQILQDYVRRQDALTTQDFRDINLMKRAVMYTTYSELTYFLFAVINTDALRSVRNSVSVLNAALEDKSSLRYGPWKSFQEAWAGHSGGSGMKYKSALDAVERSRGYLGMMEQYINFLAARPMNAPTCQVISDLCEEYDRFIREDILDSESREVFSVKETLGLSSDEVCELYPHYGTMTRAGGLNSFKDIMLHVAFGFGIPPFGANKPEDAIKKMQDPDNWEKQELSVETRSGVTFRVKPRPNSDRLIEDCYATIVNGHLRKGPLFYALNPIEVSLHSSLGETVHASLIDKMFKGLIKDTGAFAHKTQKGATILFCPDYKAIVNAASDARILGGEISSNLMLR